MISNAWEDAINIATAVGKINFQDVAAVDFFGPPTKIKSIQDMFDHVLTFNQGFAAWPLKWTAHMQCGDETDLKDRWGTLKCRKKGLAAYTWNSKGRKGKDWPYRSKDAFTFMHFCDKFFAYKRVDDQINEIKGWSFPVDWYTLSNYVNSGLIMLHEMMHANMITYEQNKNRVIQDLRMTIYKWEHDTATDTYTKVFTDENAYGALFTKVLARTERDNGIVDVTRNADNFAQFALACYVRKQLDGGNGYPYLLMADEGPLDGNTWVKPSTSMLVDKSSGQWGINPNVVDAYSTTNDIGALGVKMIEALSADDGTTEVIDNLKWIPDAEYLPEYIEQVKSLASQRDSWASSTMASGPASATPSFSSPSDQLTAPNVLRSCNGLDSRKYVSQPTLADNIKDFCRQAAQQGVLDQNSGSISRTFDAGALDEVEIAMDWTPGLDFRPDEPACNAVMKGLSDDCDGNQPENPMNWKGGGTAVSDNATYRIVSRALRQPLPNTPGGGRDVQYEVVLDKFYIWGTGYATSSFAQEPNGLLAQIKGCGATTKWKFDYGLGSDGREWSAQVQNLVFTADCIARAKQSAGGPGTKCSGDR